MEVVCKSFILCIIWTWTGSTNAGRMLTFLLEDNKQHKLLDEVSNVTSIKCAALCQRQIGCDVIIVNRTTSRCRLYKPSGYYEISKVEMHEMGAKGYMTDKGCPEKTGYVQSFTPPMCFKLQPEKLNWTQAIDACAANNQQILMVKNITKLDVITQYLSEVYPHINTFYLGLSDKASEGTWRWMDGTLNTQLPFPDGYDNNYDGNFPEDDADCAVYSTNIGLYDVSCQSKRYVLCEFDGIV